MTLHLNSHNGEDPVWTGNGQECLSKERVSPLTVTSGKTGRIGSRWRRVLSLLTRTGVRGNVQPPLGQLCIILQGVPGQDEGQMGVVTHHTRVMVGVTFAARNGKGMQTKTKQPRSLVLLEPGLIMTQDSDGSVWVRRQTGGASQTTQDVE